MKDCPPAGIL
uniref:Uncharacterized protein n=1 Tax=Anguilla anguilla TaxID=7936 RepID=A0A0E9SNM9_ANGAN